MRNRELQMTISRKQPMKCQTDSTVSTLRLDPLESDRTLTHDSLLAYMRKGLRNGNWNKLDISEKALFRCALWITKARSKISNTKLITQVICVALKIVQVVSRIGRAGGIRATMMFQEYAKPAGVFTWAPCIREWLHDSKYVWYLGVLGVNQ